MIVDGFVDLNIKYTEKPRENNHTGLNIYFDMFVGKFIRIIVRNQS